MASFHRPQLKRDLVPSFESFFRGKSLKQMRLARGKCRGNRRDNVRRHIANEKANSEAVDAARGSRNDPGSCPGSVQSAADAVREDGTELLATAVRHAAERKPTLGEILKAGMSGPSMPRARHPLS